MAFSHVWCILPPSKSKPSTARSLKKASKSNRRLLGTPNAGNEPSSPKVGCMGQIKRCKAPVAPAPGRVFNLFSASASSSSSGSSPDTGGWRLKPEKAAAAGRVVKVLASVEGVDPPLPVERKDRAPAESLWRRRCREANDLRELQLRQPLQPAAGVVV